MELRDRLINRLMEKGWTRNQSVAIAANVQAESGFRTVAHGDRGLVQGGSHGLAQWNRERLANLKRMYGESWTDFDNQVDFIDWELKNSHKHVGDRLRNIDSVEDATRLITVKYEIPANKEQRAKERIKIAQGWSDINPTTSKTQEVMAEKEFREDDTFGIVQVEMPEFDLATNTGQLASAPEREQTTEEKSDIAKINLLQDQLNVMMEMMQQQQPAQQQILQTPQQQQPEPTFNYLTDTNLFTIT